jgi:hypothetical protein
MAPKKSEDGEKRRRRREVTRGNKKGSGLENSYCETYPPETRVPTPRRLVEARLVLRLFSPIAIFYCSVYSRQWCYPLRWSSLTGVYSPYSHACPSQRARFGMALLDSFSVRPGPKARESSIGLASLGPQLFNDELTLCYLVVSWDGSRGLVYCTDFSWSLQPYSLIMLIILVAALAQQDSCGG